MQIHFLGTNGWFNTDTGETLCALIEADEGHIILDAGQGIRKIDEIINDDKPIYLFLSHFHLDHVYGFHTFPKFNFPQGITIIGQPGTKNYLNKLINHPWTCPIDALRTPITIREVEAGEQTDPFPFTCQYLVHSDPCVGYRLNLEGKVVAYCTDTGRCDNVVSLGKDADLLITECSWRVRNERPQWPHLAPEDAAELAKVAGAKQLALTHFEATNYPTLAMRDEAEAKAKSIFPNSKAMRDGMVVEI